MSRLTAIRPIFFPFMQGLEDGGTAGAGGPEDEKDSMGISNPVNTTESAGTRRPRSAGIRSGECATRPCHV